MELFKALAQSVAFAFALVATFMAAFGDDENRLEALGWAAVALLWAQA